MYIFIINLLLKVQETTLLLEIVFNSSVSIVV